jgi:hypothetical protein
MTVISKVRASRLCGRDDIVHDDRIARTALLYNYMYNCTCSYMLQYACATGSKQREAVHVCTHIQLYRQIHESLAPDAGIFQVQLYSTLNTGLQVGFLYAIMVLYTCTPVHVPFILLCILIAAYL